MQRLTEASILASGVRDTLTLFSNVGSDLLDPTRGVAAPGEELSDQCHAAMQRAAMQRRFRTMKKSIG